MKEWRETSAFWDLQKPKGRFFSCSELSSLALDPVWVEECPGSLQWRASCLQDQRAEAHCRVEKGQRTDLQVTATTPVPPGLWKMSTENAHSEFRVQEGSTNCRGSPHLVNNYSEPSPPTSEPRQLWPHDFCL